MTYKRSRKMHGPRPPSLLLRLVMHHCVCPTLPNNFTSKHSPPPYTHRPALVPTTTSLPQPTKQKSHRARSPQHTFAAAAASGSGAAGAPNPGIAVAVSLDPTPSPMFFTRALASTGSTIPFLAPLPNPSPAVYPIFCISRIPIPLVCFSKEAKSASFLTAPPARPGRPAAAKPPPPPAAAAAAEAAAALPLLRRARASSSASRAAARSLILWGVVWDAGGGRVCQWKWCSLQFFWSFSRFGFHTTLLSEASWPIQCAFMTVNLWIQRGGERLQQYRIGIRDGRR